MAITLLYWVITLICWAYALRYGGKTGLWGFLLFIGMTGGSIFATWREPVARASLEAWRGLNPLLFASDGFYFLGLVVLALTSQRYWPIWSAGFALSAVLTHFGPLLDPYSDPRLYRGLATIWQLPIFATMVIGIARDRRFERGLSASQRRSYPSRKRERLTR